MKKIRVAPIDDKNPDAFAKVKNEKKSSIKIIAIAVTVCFGLLTLAAAILLIIGAIGIS